MVEPEYRIEKLENQDSLKSSLGGPFEKLELFLVKA